MLHNFLEFYKYMNGKEGMMLTILAGIEVRIEADESANDWGVSYNTQLCVCTVTSHHIYGYLQLPIDVSLSSAHPSSL